MGYAFPPALVPFHASETVENQQEIENPAITLDTYVNSDECCLLHCIPPKGTLIWFLKKVREMKPGELTKILKTPM